MKKNIVINLSPTTPVSAKNFIFQKGTPSDKFVLILQGKVNTCPQENWHCPVFPQVAQILSFLSTCIIFIYSQTFAVIVSIVILLLLIKIW